jgi:hypothetical protein
MSIRTLPGRLLDKRPGTQANKPASQRSIRETAVQPFRSSPAKKITGKKENIMKYICLGYLDENKWDQLTQEEQTNLIDDCMAYDEILKANGHFIGGEALQSARTAATLRWTNQQVSITDGPYAETKEQLGGVLILEARDLNHAIQLMSKHPGVKVGPFEIRPADDLSQLVADSQKRRAAK